MGQLKRHQPGPYAGSYDLKSVEKNVADALDPILRKPHITDSILFERTMGAVVDGLTLSTTTTNIAHGLGRTWRGWYIVDSNANETVYRDSSSTADSTFFLPLKASGTVTVKLVVF